MQELYERLEVRVNFLKNKQAEMRNIMRQLPKSGEVYKHFKGNCYRIITLAKHTETGETLVIYQALYGDNEIYARELSMFMGPVDQEKYPNASQKMRFELLGGMMEEPAAQISGNGLMEENGSVPEEHRLSEENSSVVCEQEPEREQKPGKKWESGKEWEPEKRQEPEKEQKTENEEPQIDPGVLAFLDADSSKERLQVLMSMKGRLTDKMINTMAIAIDVEIKPGDITERYEELKYCLATRERFEGRRLR